MDSQKLMTLRIIWGAMLVGVVIFCSVGFFVIGEVSRIEDDPTVGYILMAMALGATGVFFFIRSQKQALADHTEADAQKLFSLTIVCFASAEAVGLLGGVALFIGQSVSLAIGLIGISLILMTMEFPKSELNS